MSMWKYPAAMDVDKIAANLHPNVRNDGGRTLVIVLWGPLPVTPPIPVLSPEVGTWTNNRLLGQVIAAN